MSPTLSVRAKEEIDRWPRAPAAGRMRRVGSAIGLAAISVVDLMALDDLTTASVSMLEVGWLIASIPALLTLAYYTFRRSSNAR